MKLSILILSSLLLAGEGLARPSPIHHGDSLVCHSTQSLHLIPRSLMTHRINHETITEPKDKM
jgi:hypothetical protein